VIACKNAAAAALDILEARLDVPVNGVIEPRLRAAATVIRGGRVGAIATSGTVASGAYQRLAATLAHIELTCAGCPRFLGPEVETIEGWKWS
jgi:glutamate racemase